MIYLITPHHYASHFQELEEMYKLRCDYFHKYLNWNVNIENEMEKDGYDERHAYYLIYKDPQGIIKGCLRLIEMIKESMFESSFDFLLPNLKDFKKPGYWEISRLAIDPKCTPEETKKIFTSLVIALNHFGLYKSPVKTYLALSYPITIAFAKSLDVPIEIIKEGIIKNEPVVVSVFSPNIENHKKLLEQFDVSLVGFN